MNNIVLIGLSGSGKSSLGKVLAEKMGYDFLDTDELIVKKYGSIQELFAIGEEYFRQRECETILSLEGISDCVIATGGGAILNPKNMQVFKDDTIIYLNRDIVQILKNNLEDRPLLAQDKNTLAKLQEERKELYLKYADIIYANDSDDIELCADKIINILKEFKKQMKVLIINGPNLNMLGKREPDLYGKQDYGYLVNLINEYADKNNLHADIVQTNIEGEIISLIQDSDKKYAGVVLNPGGYTHSSVAILDAIKSINIPVIEVHITNIYSREEFRNSSITAKGCLGVISGLGFYGYICAMSAIINISEKANEV